MSECDLGKSLATLLLVSSVLAEDLKPTQRLQTVPGPVVPPHHASALGPIWVSPKPELKYQYPLGSEPLHDYPAQCLSLPSLRYFPSNFGHGIVGLEDGCTFVAGYNDGSFDDALHSNGLSNWVSTTPPEVVAQALGMTVEQVTASIKPGRNTL
ncbi:hypothetical protein WJX84_001810 [Apatococcus fuscideae]|uniref:Uncharacterized protein n=1 Tax=Apatococcus fuscideae TaxID=2026836 RepID=A0AAW1SCN3_9CHLO